MPRDGSDVYSQPPGTAAVSGTNISSSAFNQLISDIAADLNTPRPISAGGTGATSPETALVSLGAAPANDRLLPWDAGDIKPTARTTAAEGWLFCFGQAVSRTGYPDLFAAIGTTHGSGDGSTTFNVPDYRGRTLAGRDNMGGTSADRLTGLSGGVNGDTLGAVGGAETHTLTAAQVAKHTHPISGTAASAGAHTHSINTQIGGDLGQSSYVNRNTSGTNASLISPIQSAGAHTHSVSGTATANTDGGGAHNNVQPTAIVNFVIKT